MKATIVNEITFYLSNQAGQLARITQTFSDEGVSIKGLLVSEGFGKSVVRVVVDEEEKAMDILKAEGIDDVTIEPVLAVLMASERGVIAELSRRLGDASINIENIYVTESTQGDTIAYLSVRDVEQAQSVFG
jgi:hypothetical protein